MILSRIQADYNPIVKTTLACAGVLCLFAPALFAQSATSNPTSGTLQVSCDATPRSSRIVHSEVFVSPDGKRRAYAEIEAFAVHPQKTPGYDGPQCVNWSRLFVAAQDGQFRLVFLQEPADTEAGNSLRIVDWSEDSRQLLLEVAQWQYDSPGITRSPVVFDSLWAVFQQPDMAQVLEKHFGMDCGADVHVLGFLPEAKIAIETKPLAPESEEVLGVQNCSKKKGQWALTIGSESLTALPETAKIHHYAKTEPPPK